MFKNVTLEMSLKPFKSTEDGYIKTICKKFFTQWSNLTKEADVVSVMLWCSDGSEILEYKGNLEEEFEWARYIGGANPREGWDKVNDPDGVGLHTRNYLYMENPPVFTYAILKKIIEIIKEVGHQITGKVIRVGETFDPGPEFAKSDFKYHRHHEVCAGVSMGEKSMVCCYGILHGDGVKYAGFPNGIPEGTPFGTFFGRQCNHFLKDLGFDYLWLSNGFGFGTESWGTTGAIYDGKEFHVDKFDEVKEHILSFWKLFRQECPDIRLETRGTNLSTGIDLATDGVPLRDIYKGKFNFLPPPNSPWAALDGDFGLELSGYMSRIAELPEEEYLFRYYVHDPWWVNSPWLDRYEGQPHDIYLPLAVSRIDQNGEVRTPTHLNLLTIDNSFGEMPDVCPNEVIPHLLKAAQHEPDRVSPVVWIYPFNEYHEGRTEEEIKEMFFGDWYMRGAINNGLAVSSVVSTDNFISSLGRKPELYGGSVLISVIPKAGSAYETAVIKAVESGSRFVFYGPVSTAGQQFLNLLGLKLAEPIAGRLNIEIDQIIDCAAKEYPKVINHKESMSAGGIDTILSDTAVSDTQVWVKVFSEGGDERAAGIHRSAETWQGGAVVWLRGTSSNTYVKGQHLLQMDSPEEFFISEMLMRYGVAKLGTTVVFEKRTASDKNPVVMIHRNNNATIFSGYMPNTTVGIRLKLPLGAPLLMGYETHITDGYSTYHMARAWHCECRVFIEQESEKTVVCKERPPVSYTMKRKVEISGLEKATLRIFPEVGCEETMEVVLNAHYPYVISKPFDSQWIDSAFGRYLELRNVTGEILFSMPFSTGNN